MGSKYSKKLAKPVLKQGGFVARPVTPVCTNCAYSPGFAGPYTKCRCGGTLQTFGVKSSKAGRKP